MSRDEDEVAVLPAQLLDRDERDDPVPPVRLSERVDGLSSGRRGGLRGVQNREKVRPSPFGKSEYPAPAPRPEDSLEPVVAVFLHAGERLATSDATLVEVDRDAFQESLAAHGDDEVLVRDHVRCRRLLLFPLREDDGPARVSEFSGQRVQLLDHERELAGLAGEKRPQLSDGPFECAPALLELCAVERRELSEPHPEDRFRLRRRESEALLEMAARRGPVSRAPDQLDHLVDMVERQEEALDDVPLRLRLLEFVPGPSNDDLEPVIPVAFEGIPSG